MKLDRLIGILTVLLQNDKITAPELAKRFQVSRRTILRDIDSLCLAGVPVVATRGGDGGISVMEGYKINKNVLTGEELQNLIAGLKGMDSVSKTSHFENLMTKLSPSGAMVNLANCIMIDLSSYHKDSLSEKIGLIRQAITGNRLIAFNYYYPKGETHRVIEPYFIQFRWGAWYVYGFCLERQDFRLFKLDRLWAPALTEECFSPRPVSPDAAWETDAFPEPYSVRLLFDKSVRFRLIEEYGPDCYTETGEGLLLDLSYTNRDHIKTWILGFGDAAAVLAPEDFREEMKQTAENILKKYL